MFLMASFAYIVNASKVMQSKLSKLNFIIMNYINLKKLKELQETGLSLTELAKFFNVDLFDLNNFIYSHKGRTGTYPVDGSRSRKTVKTRYEYPDNKALANKLKTKTILVVSIELDIPYSTLYSHIKQVGIRWVKKPTRKKAIKNKSIADYGNELFDSLKNRK